DLCDRNDTRFPRDAPELSLATSSDLEARPLVPTKIRSGGRNQLPDSPMRDKILPVVILLVQVVVILAFARVVRWLVVPLGQPAVIGEMVAGLMLGPSFVGWLIPQASAVLFAPSTLPALNSLSQVGLVLFMFFVGARMDRHKVHKRRNVAMVTS